MRGTATMAGWIVDIPCPFCGAETVSLFPDNGLSPPEWNVGCYTEGCRGSKDGTDEGYQTKRDALEAWARRVAPWPDPQKVRTEIDAICGTQ